MGQRRVRKRAPRIGDSREVVGRADNPRQPVEQRQRLGGKRAHAVPRLGVGQARLAPLMVDERALQGQHLACPPARHQDHADRANNLPGHALGLCGVERTDQGGHLLISQ